MNPALGLKYSDHLPLCKTAEQLCGLENVTKTFAEIEVCSKYVKFHLLINYLQEVEENKYAQNKNFSIYHSHAAYDGAEQKDHVLLDFLAPLQQDVEELHKAEGGQKEAQHL